MSKRKLFVVLAVGTLAAGCASVATTGLVAVHPVVVAVTTFFVGVALGSFSVIEVVGSGARLVARGLALVAAVSACLLGGAALDATERPGPMVWVQTENAHDAFQRARREHRPILLDFGAGWCPPAFRFDGTTDDHEAVRREAARFVAIRVDATDDEDPRIAALLAEHGVVGLPYLAVIDRDGRHVADFFESDGRPGPLLAAMKRVR